MNGSILVSVVFTILACLVRLVKETQGGVCWSSTNKLGRCTEMLSDNMTKQDCCEQFSGVTTAWSKDNIDSGKLFFLRVLGEGVPCESCKNSCKAIDCGPGKKCAMRIGRPKCICSPCREKGKRSRIPVCGSDGKNYANACRLKKTACRRKQSALTVAYTGYCQSSCKTVKCPRGKFCIHDQNLTPHCVRCMIRCSRGPENKIPVCGADGVTYKNICALRRNSCTSGKAIPLAYVGKCKAEASCGNIECTEHQSCLEDKASGLPRCVTCNQPCDDGIGKELGGPICGTNNQTYQSWCHMIKDACDLGYVIETKFQGTCEDADLTSSTEDPVTMEATVNASISFTDMYDLQ